MQFSGVNEAYSANRLLLGSWTPESIQNTQRLPPQTFRRPRNRRLPGWTIVNENGGENKWYVILISLAIDFHGTFRETGRYPDTCNNRPYRAYTGTFHAHPGSQRLHICSYYRPAVKETSQKQAQNINKSAF